MLEFSELTSPETERAPALATVCVVGLGYVGLPVAVEFGKRRATIGFDLSEPKVERLKRHEDATGEVASAELKSARHLAIIREACPRDGP